MLMTSPILLIAPQLPHTRSEESLGASLSMAGASLLPPHAATPTSCLAAFAGDDFLRSAVAARSFNGMLSFAPIDVAPLSATCTTDGSTTLGPIELQQSQKSRTLGRGASAIVELHVDDEGKPLWAEKTVRTLTKEKSDNARRELACATRILSREGPPLPSVIRVFGAQYDAAEHTTTLRMEYMDAGHAGLLGALEEPALAALTRQLLAGLRALHEELRVIHRDLKPENVLLNRSGVVKIADFGVAALLADGESTAEDQVGTIMQMAPERLRGEPHGFASDIWSLGVTVAQLALGQHPFVLAATRGGAGCRPTEKFWLLAEVIKHTATPEECEEATHNAIDHAFSASAQTACGADLKAFVHACTATDPAQRPTIDELSRHPFVLLHDREALNAAIGKTTSKAASPLLYGHRDG
jgi:serine/threonine protein kinase